MWCYNRPNPKQQLIVTKYVAATCQCRCDNLLLRNATIAMASFVAIKLFFKNKKSFVAMTLL